MSDTAIQTLVGLTGIITEQEKTAAPHQNWTGCHSATATAPRRPL